MARKRSRRKASLELPYRSRKSNLTDNELMLLDAIVKLGSLAFEHLSIEDYSFHMNTHYSHGLEDNDLWNTLQQLCQRGILHADWRKIWSIDQQQYYDEDRFKLTDEGAAIWEIERMPIWNLWIDTLYIGYEGNRATFRVHGLNETTVKECYQAYADAELIRAHEAPQLRTLMNESVFPWKCFPEVIELTVPVTKETMQGDWDIYEEKRCWWRNLYELQKFLEENPSDFQA